ncbi:MAG TPA: hypothetical protein VMV31_05960 [Terriglobales bacterium]|nr:hypothetical protein [Terriglobales bacterium]
MERVENEAANEIRRLIHELLPKMSLEEVAVRPGTNADGEPSLFVRVVFQRTPERSDFRAMRIVLSRFRDWLSAEKADERFPYFEVSTTAEERHASEASERA